MAVWATVETAVWIGLTDKTLALSLDHIINAFRRVVFVRFDESLHVYVSLDRLLGY